MPISLIDGPRLSLAEAARKLDVHVNTLHRWRQTRGLRFIRMGQKCFVLRDELERFVASMSDPPSAAEHSDDYEKRAAAANAQCDALGL